MSKSYWEKLRDPRWQKKRLEALNKAEFRCQLCYDSESTLHVHHKQYFKGRDPWDYQIEQLAVLCEACHEQTHSQDDALHFVGSFLDVDGPYSRNTAASLVAGFAGLSQPAKTADLCANLCGSIAVTLLYFESPEALSAIRRAALAHRAEMFDLLLEFALEKNKEGE